MKNYEQMKRDFLSGSGFIFDGKEEGYTKEVKDDGKVVGLIFVRLLTGNVVSNTPLFIPNKRYYCLPTLEGVNNLLAYYDNKLTGIELDRVVNDL